MKSVLNLDLLCINICLLYSQLSILTIETKNQKSKLKLLLWQERLGWTNVFSHVWSSSSQIWQLYHFGRCFVSHNVSPWRPEIGQPCWAGMLLDGELSVLKVRWTSWLVQLQVGMEGHTGQGSKWKKQQESHPREFHWVKLAALCTVYRANNSPQTDFID